MREATPQRSPRGVQVQHGLGGARLGVVRAHGGREVVVHGLGHADRVTLAATHGVNHNLGVGGEPGEFSLSLLA